ncbi:hypothetical protein Lal_00018514 [Lupinus albus]|nr:hypothetical protein Lal_00018514 [Lupinus albus]
MSHMVTITLEFVFGFGRVGKLPSTTIEGVLYVEGLKHNMLSINQLCEKGFHVAFYSDKCIIEDKVSKESKLVGKRINNIYMIALNDVSLKNKCFVEFCDDLGITLNFSALRTLEQNHVVKRKKQYLEELAHTMLNETNFPK